MLRAGIRPLRPASILPRRIPAEVDSSQGARPGRAGGRSRAAPGAPRALAAGVAPASLQLERELQVSERELPGLEPGPERAAPTLQIKRGED